MNQVNEKYSQNFDWSDLFNDLFVPSKLLYPHIKKIKDEIGSKYVAIHIRFLNLLGDDNENEDFKVLGQEQREKLISDCINKIKIIQADSVADHVVTVLCSDSMTFLNIVKKELPNVYIVKGNSRHIDKVKVISEEDVLKLFSDMYILAGAQKVYSIVGGELYKSAFPEYSAKINRTEFERICL